MIQVDRESDPSSSVAPGVMYAALSRVERRTAECKKQEQNTNERLNKYLSLRDHHAWFDK
jgi:hypothetical protein